MAVTKPMSASADPMDAYKEWFTAKALTPGGEFHSPLTTAFAVPTNPPWGGWVGLGGWEVGWGSTYSKNEIYLGTRITPTRHPLHRHMKGTSFSLMKFPGGQPGPEMVIIQ